MMPLWLTQLSPLRILLSVGLQHPQALRHYSIECAVFNDPISHSTLTLSRTILNHLAVTG